MRFLTNEHEVITDALRKHGVDPSTVLFVKRKGWLHIEVKENARAFAFHRKKRTILDDDGHWQEVIEYMVHRHGQAKEGLDLAGMIDELHVWLNGRTNTSGN